jgi:hypothetical protein
MITGCVGLSSKKHRMHDSVITEHLVLPPTIKNIIPPPLVSDMRKVYKGSITEDKNAEFRWRMEESPQLT